MGFHFNLTLTLECWKMSIWWRWNVLIRGSDLYISLKRWLRRVARIKKEARMTRIEGQESEKEKLTIPPLWVTFLWPAQVIRSYDKALKIIDLYINTLEYENKRQSVETKVTTEDEMLPQLSIHIIEDIPTRAFARKLADEEKF